MGVASSRPVMSTTATIMAVICVVMAEAGSEVTLTFPPPLVMEERWETRLPVLPGGGAHGLPAWSELEGSGGAMARLEVEQPLVSHGVLEVDIPFNGEEDIGVEPPAIPPS